MPAQVLRAQANQMDKKSLSQLRSEFFEYFKSLTPDVLAEFADNFPISNPEGHMLSGKNISFLKFQAGDKINFTVVAGYRQWMKFDRQVRKGQHGFWIFIPRMTKTKVESNGSTTTQEDCEGFLMAKVFDISQTFDINDAELSLANSESQVPEEAFA